MAQALSTVPLPKWLRKALRKKVLSWDEAVQMHHNSLMADDRAEWTPLPESLWKAARRVHLLERRPVGGRQ